MPKPRRRPREEREPLTAAAKFRRVFSAQARCAPTAAEFTDDEQAAFAALVGDDGSFIDDVAAKFQALWSAHLEGRQARAAAAAKPPVAKSLSRRVRPAKPASKSAASPAAKPADQPAAKP